MDPVVLNNFLVDVRGAVDGLVQELRAEQPTLRDWFAMAALQGLLAFPHHDGFQFPPPAHTPPADVASHAYALADAMLSEREPKAVSP